MIRFRPTAASTIGRALLLTLIAGCAGDSGGRDAGRDTGAPVAATTPATAAPSAHAPTLTVYKSPTCGCCRAWAEHMEENGFRVVAIDTGDLDAVKRRHGVKPEHGACHTALVDGYVVEGHVPAADVRRLLAERPRVVGLAVPGMPMGSPGMDGPYKDAYQVLSWDSTGATGVFANH